MNSPTLPTTRRFIPRPLPIISKGGRLRIGSSPFGAAGQFWEIANQAIRPYPGYTRAVAPWWSCYAFCTDPPAARRDAPQMDTAARVARFGNHRIAAIFENLDIDDFRQEYEAAFVDESRKLFHLGGDPRRHRADLLHAAATVTGAGSARPWPRLTRSPARFAADTSRRLTPPDTTWGEPTTDPS